MTSAESAEKYMVGPGHPTRSPAEVVDVIRNAFAARKHPGGDGFYGDDESQAIERHLSGVGAFDLTCDVVESYDGDQTSLFSFMQPSARAYFLPSFMIMAVEDFERSNWYPYEVLHAFRYWPLWRDQGNWVSEMRWLWLYRHHRALVPKSLFKWFHEGLKPSRNEFVSCLIDEERRAMLAFFEYLQAAHLEDLGRDAYHGRSVAAAKAMVSGGDLASRLGVRGRSECLAMREVLRVLCRKYPDHAPARAEAEEIARELTLAADRA